MTFCAYARIRRRAASPIRPAPMSSNEAGSGVVDSVLASKTEIGFPLALSRIKVPPLVWILENSHCNTTELCGFSGPTDVFSPQLTMLESETSIKFASSIVLGLPLYLPSPPKLEPLIHHICVAVTKLKVPTPLMSIEVESLITAEVAPQQGFATILFVSAVAVIVKVVDAKAVPPSEPESVPVKVKVIGAANTEATEIKVVKTNDLIK